ncbi:hypothetical protein H072_11148 [Dactylellina haptotyla CBS 200.50]|uniref:cyclin-dependent kinase n=1 Tax=Dactylellina haptotyla (strain CBS 200.50) TaxID=1284197 RepID=S8A2S8_DACHA|nr:hypothetical protein H072_11148 [Dactylellina haptotyla CBS 200.50]
MAISISISARFQATHILSSKIAESNFGITPADALSAAKEIEKGFAKLASSEDHYQSLISAFQPEPQNSESASTSVNDANNTTSVPKLGSQTGYETAQTLLPPNDHTKEEEAVTSSIAFGKYRNCVEHSIGGSSTIFRSKDPASNQTVALKVTSTWVQPHDAYREARLLERFGSEKTHVLELCETETLRGEFILVFPFYPLTLADLVDKGNKSKHLPQIFNQVATALSFIHANGVIHRDIKPANILLRSPEGPACLCDFGTAWATDDHHPDETPNGKVIEIGTTCYRSPETLFGYRAYGTEVDIWALGCVIAEAENGGHPLFDAGELGTDLRLILSIFESLGTPNLESWPEAKHLPDFGKMIFNEFPPQSWETLLPNADTNAVDLVKNMITYSQHLRFSAEKVLQPLEVTLLLFKILGSTDTENTNRF